MTDQERVQELLTRSRLPDPCTLVFSVPKEAPPSVNEEGRTWSVEQWIYLARRQGHTATRADSRTGHGIPTWCGDIDITGHRRPVSYFREIVFGLRTKPAVSEVQDAK